MSAALFVMARQRSAPSPLTTLFRDNLERLMAAHKDLNSQSALARQSKVGQTSIGRILAQEQSPTLDLVYKLARTFDLEPWQMLIEDLDPRDPPITKSIDERQRALFDRFRKAAQDLAHYNAERPREHDEPKS
jgi:transcriptional regulator with XRE-family HTH domain